MFSPANAVDKWKAYLQHGEFIISTDHKSLLHLGEQKLSNGIQHKAFIKFLGLQYKIVYKKGKENGAVDALSRNTDRQQLTAISECKPKLLEVVVEGYEKDPEAKKMLTELSVTRSNSKGYQLVDGVIRYKNSVVRTS
jgi:hypothetical protein